MFDHLLRLFVLAALPLTPLAAQHGTIRPVDLPPSLPARVPVPDAPLGPPMDATAGNLEEKAFEAPTPAAIAAAAMAAEIEERRRTAELNATLAQAAEDQHRAATQARIDAARKTEEDHQAALAAHQRAVFESERQHAAAMDEWRRRVEACKAGDTVACAR